MKNNDTIQTPVINVQKRTYSIFERKYNTSEAEPFTQPRKNKQYRSDLNTFVKKTSKVDFRVEEADEKTNNKYQITPRKQIQN